MVFTPLPASPGTLRTIFLSSFVPRECGLATFTEDLISAVVPYGAVCHVAAMNRPREEHLYGQRVMMTIRENRLTEYLAAAGMINQGCYHVLSVQHEFGIFGGEECDYLIRLLRAVEIPVVTTFHTILRRPSPAMRRHLQAVAKHSTAVVVMNSLAIEILEKVYEVDPRKIRMIHHGAPTMQRERQYSIKNDFNLQQKKVISTFGLLSSGKGLEYAVMAMPRLVAEHPEVLYLILGQTHPVVKQQEGERYRDFLSSIAHDLGVQDHVIFVDKYFTKAELMAYLQATDIYLTPYLNMEQVTSGTLAYAMACGRPLVSTPYLYARFLLGDNRGLLVPPRDPDGIADACLAILDTPELLINMKRTNWWYGQEMIWPRVGQQYMELFQDVAAIQIPVPSLLRVQA